MAGFTANEREDIWIKIKMCIEANRERLFQVDDDDDTSDEDDNDCTDVPALHR